MNKSTDIYGLKTIEVKKQLEQIISSSPKGCEMMVTHGYRGGRLCKARLEKG